MEMDEKQVQIEEVPTKCRIRDLFGLHNQARLVSVVLAILSGYILSSVWNHQLILDQAQLACLYISVGCLASLVIGSIGTMKAFYIPTVYLMRFVVISVICWNAWLIVETAGKLDTFIAETSLRSKASTIFYLNRNFTILRRCLNLSVHAWICLLIFGCLQLVAKDYYRLRSAKTARGFCIGRRIRRFVTLDSLRFNRPKSPVFEMDPSGKVVESKVEEFGHEASVPDSIKIISAQIEALKEAEEQHKLKMAPNQQLPQMVQQPPKPPTCPHPIQLIQEQIAKFNRINEPTNESINEPKSEVVPDQQMGPMNTSTEQEPTQHQENHIENQEHPIENQEQHHENAPAKYETFVC